MKTSFRLLSLALAPGLLGLAAHAVPEEGFETPTTVKAAEALPAERIKGPHHQVEPQATGDGVSLSFRIRSDFGEFEAPSRALALVRIDEVAAIARLKEIGSSEVFAKALAASVEKKADAVAQVVKDPEGTAKGVGRGLKRMWGKAKQGASDAAEAAKTKDDETGEKKDEQKPSASDVGSEVLGVNKAKRQLAKTVGADPYSSNPALQAELDRLAKAAVAGGITGSLGTSVPGLNQVAAAGSLAWDLPPEDLKARNQKSLAAMGCDAACQKPFFANRAYTPSLQTAVVSALEGLDGLADRAALVGIAAGAEDEVEALFYPGSLKLLAAARKGGQKLSKAQAFGRTPSALTADGTLVVAAAVDLLFWTEDIAAAADRPVSGASKRQLWISGALSERTRLELKARGWTVHEGVPAS